MKNLLLLLAKKFYKISFFGLVVLLSYASVYQISNAQTTDNTQMKQEMLLPVVFIEANTAFGSGVVIYSAQQGNDDVWYTYIITGKHVVGDQSSVLIMWSQEEFYNRSDEFFTADVIAIGYKLALLRVRDKKNGTLAVARLLSNDDIVEVFDRVWAIGSGLGMQPFPTEGIVSNPGVSFELDEGENQILIQFSAPVINGNSGGGLFMWSETHAQYELIGIVDSILSNFDGIPITHMGFAVPVNRIRAFLVNEGFDFILDEKELR